jgi:hypothetical protein
MARFWFGDSDDWSLSVGAGGILKLAPSTRKYYDAETGGTQHTDLLIGGTTPATAVAGDGLPVRFQGPDGVSEMWESSNNGPRVLVVSTDVRTSVADAADQVAAALDEVRDAVDANDSLMTTVANNTGSDFRGALGALVGALGAAFFPTKGTSKRNGQKLVKERKLTLAVDKGYPSGWHDHMIMWINEATREAWSIGKDGYLRQSTWSVGEEEASYFGNVKLAAAANRSFARNGVLFKTAAGTLLIEETDTNGGTNTKLVRATSPYSSSAYVWTAATSTIGFLGPQSIVQDPVTGYIYLCEYTVDVTVTTIKIWRSTDDGANWTAWKSHTRSDGGANDWRHIHSGRPDPVSGRVHFCIGDQNGEAGLWRVNAGGTDVEKVVTNNQVTGLGTAPCRSVDVMFFPNYIAWACDGGGYSDGDYLYRMNRNQIGQTSPVVERIAETNSTGWYAQQASSDGSVWVVSTATEDLGNINDKAAHLYAVSNDGATLDEVDTKTLEGGDVIGFGCYSGLANGSGAGTAFWLRSHNTSPAASFQVRARLAWGVAALPKPPKRSPEYLREGRSAIIALTSGQTITFGHTRARAVMRRLSILNAGAYRISGTGSAKVQAYNVTTSTLLGEWPSLDVRSLFADTQQAIGTYTTIAAGDMIEFRVVETGGGTPTMSVFFEFGWAAP